MGQTVPASLAGELPHVQKLPTRLFLKFEFEYFLRFFFIFLN
jgi:hypothetical protein